MKLLIALIVVLLIFFSSTFAISQLEGDLVKPLRDPEIIQTKSNQLFLTALLSSLDSGQVVEIQQMLDKHSSSPLEALQSKVLILKGIRMVE